MEKYLKTVREMYSQFKKKEAHPMEKYVGRLAKVDCGDLELMGYGCPELSAAGCGCAELEVVGYSCGESGDEALLIVDASQNGGWSSLGPHDVVFKRKCKYYWYVNISALID